MCLMSAMALEKSASATSFTTPDVLIVHTANWQTNLVTDFVSSFDADSRIGTVTPFNAETTPLNASDLAGIEVAIVGTNYEFSDPDQTGDVLADFVDQGGRVIQSTWAFACTQETSGPVKWGLGGRWEDEGYASIIPIAPLGGACADYDFNRTQSLLPIDPSSPFLANVGPLAGVINGLNLGLQTAPGATLIAEWDSPANMPAIAIGANCVMGVSVYIPDVMTTNKYSLSQRNSVLNLFANLATLSCVASTPDTTTPDTTTPGLPVTGTGRIDVNTTVALSLLVLGLLFVARVRRVD